MNEAEWSELEMLIELKYGISEDDNSWIGRVPVLTLRFALKNVSMVSSTLVDENRVKVASLLHFAANPDRFSKSVKLALIEYEYNRISGT